MSKIHYFQRYSQPENVMTNNALLFLGRIYSMSPNLFELTLQNLLGDSLDEPVPVGVSMVQQERNELGVPDGMLVQEAFRVLVETKTSKAFDAAQLKRHLKQLDGKGRDILLLLSPERLTEIEFEDLMSKVKPPAQVVVRSVSFEDLIEAAMLANTREDQELEEMIEDYREYCSAEEMLPVHKFWMRAITAGQSFDHNMSHGLYYDDASRGFSDHAYLGLYRQKAVRAIGKIVDMITADLVDGELVNVRSEMRGTANPEHLERIKEVIPIAKEGPGYDIATGHRFFMVDRFMVTDFEKDSPNALMRTKFFDLRHYVPLTPERTLPDVETIARELNGKGWKRDKKEFNK